MGVLGPLHPTIDHLVKDTLACLGNNTSQFGEMDRPWHITEGHGQVMDIMQST